MLRPWSPYYRLQRLEHLARKFDHKASNIEKWAGDHPEKLSRNDDIEAANLAEATVSAIWLSC